jgi:hypothetical protein
MTLVASLMSWLCDGYWPASDKGADRNVPSCTGQHDFTPLRLLASGDTSDLHLATTATDPETLYLLKVARTPEGNVHLDIEQRTLTTLRKAAGATTYGKYLPELVGSFPSTDGLPHRSNVFRWVPGLYTLEQVHEQHQALDGRHLAWIFKRLLTVLGFSHRQNRLHGAVLPCHVLIDPASHGLQLVGWGQSIPVGQRLRAVPARYHAWYPAEVHRQAPTSPATDLFLAARCLVYLAGGDPVSNRMPDAVPPPMQRFLTTCLLESAAMRPDNAWDVLEQFDELLQSLYGPPKFCELTLT